MPGATARRVNDARRDGGRVIAVGTTVVRALETVVDEAGTVHAGERLDRPRGHAGSTIVRSVDGLLTGWHEPGGVAPRRCSKPWQGRELLERSYTVALEEGYLWHELEDIRPVLR